MELRCVVAVIRHGDRTPKQKMKVEVRHPKFFEIFEKYGGRADGHVKLKRPKQLQEVLDIARFLLSEIEQRAAPELAEKQVKLEQLKSVLEMYGHFSGINRKVQMKYQPKGRPKGSSSDDGKVSNGNGEPSLVLIVKWGGELTPAGRVQAEELGRIFRCMYPGGQGRHYTGEYAGTQGLGLLRLHSTYRHDLKIYASDEGRVQMTAAAFAKGLLALEGELTPILVQMVKSANTNGLLDNDCDASKHQNMAKARLHALLQQDREFTNEDKNLINPCNAISIAMALDFVKNPVKCCERVQTLIQRLMNIVRHKKDDPKTKDAVLYHGETWELMGRRWGKIEKDFFTKNKTFDISKIPDIYDCIKYDLQHNQHTLQFEQAEELYITSKYLADIVIPQEYGLTMHEKLTISQGICTPLLKKIRADLQRNIEETGEESVNRLNPRYSHGVSSPGRHVRTRLYFTSESHVHSLLTVLRYGGLISNVRDEQWRRAMEYVSMVSELNYMSQIVIMLYEDPTKDPSSEERFHVELHFSPGVNCCVQKNLPPGPGFRPHSRNDQPKPIDDSPDSQPSTSLESPPVLRKQTPNIKVSQPIPIRQTGEECEEKRSLRMCPVPQEQRSRSFDHTRKSTHDQIGSDRSNDLDKGGSRGEAMRVGPCYVLISGANAQQVNGQRGGLDLRALDLAHVTVVVENKRKSIAAAKCTPSASQLGPPQQLLDSSLSAVFRFSSSAERDSALENSRKTIEEFERSRSEGRRRRSWDSDSRVGGDTFRWVGDLSSHVRQENTRWAAVDERRHQRHSIAGTKHHHHHTGTTSAADTGERTAASTISSGLTPSGESSNRRRRIQGATSSTSSVFSTAVISGAASAPNLTNIIPNTGSVSEGCGGVPPIRPLETLHNALSLRQLDSFLDRMTKGLLMKTPASSPPRLLNSPTASSMGWSDPPSFVSSSGAPSPTTLSDIFSPQGLMGAGNDYYEHRDSIDIMEMYSRTQSDEMHFSPIIDFDDYDDDEEGLKDGGESSGEETPVSESDVCSDTVDTTVVPTDTTRARLADICWHQQQPHIQTPPLAEGVEGGVKKASGRFVCTSVSEDNWVSQGSFSSWKQQLDHIDSHTTPSAGNSSSMISEANDRERGGSSPLVTMASTHSTNVSRGFELPQDTPSQQ